MPPYQKPRLSVLEVIFLTFKIFRALGNGLLAFITAPFRGSAGAAKISNHVKLAILRSLTGQISNKEVRWLNPSLNETYPAFAKEKGFTPKDITLEDGTKAYWLGDPSADKVLIWFHGGGYNLPPDPAHLPFCYSLTHQNPSVSVLMLAYTLAPDATYPTQLREAVALVSTLVKDRNFTPSNISIAGDSAGGNLALGVLSHLLHPHPQIPALDLHGDALSAVILLAPWVSFSLDWPSVRDNAAKDVVGPGPSNYWSGNFLRGAPRDAYNEPLSLGPEDKWWDGLESVVRLVFVASGRDEVLYSSVKELARRLKTVHPHVEEVVAKDEWHNKPLLTALGGGGVQGEKMKEFVRERL